MANSILTPTAVTREVLRVLHEKASFIGTVNRSYDDSFAKTGAKIGDSLKIRLPNQYTVRTGKTLDAQDTSEESVTLTVATQKGVDMNFSSAELAMSLDDFSKRIIQPAVAVLVSNIEADMLSSVTKDVWNLVGTAGTTPNSFLTFGQARAKLNQGLAPKDGNRFVQMDSLAMATMVEAGKGLFHDSAQIKEAYREGMIGRSAGFDWYENERCYTHTNGADHTTVTINDATIASGDTTIVTSGGTVTVGSVFVFDGTTKVYRVHPETKVAYTGTLGLQQFVVTAVSGSGGSQTITFDPPLITTGAKQNVNTLPVTTEAITFVGSASTSYPMSLAYHKDAFAFATADLPIPEGVHFAAREQMDGVSIRIVRQYDINNDNIPCRLDILHGYETLRAALACRIIG